VWLLYACAHCGNVRLLRQNARKHRFCTPQCAAAYRRIPVFARPVAAFECFQCKTRFMRRVRARPPARTFCGTKCAYEHLRVKNTVWGADDWPGRNVLNGEQRARYDRYLALYDQAGRCVHCRNFIPVGSVYHWICLRAAGPHQPATIANIFDRAALLLEMSRLGGNTMISPEMIKGLREQAAAVILPKD
jgi:hypothetical protein